MRNEDDVGVLQTTQHKDDRQTTAYSEREREFIGFTYVQNFMCRITADHRKTPQITVSQTPNDRNSQQIRSKELPEGRK